MNLKSLTRRALLRAMPVAPVAARVAAQELVSGKTPTNWGLGDFVGGNSVAETPACPAPLSLAKQALQEILHKRQREIAERVEYRFGVLEADLHGLVSVAPVSKIRMQIARDRKRQSMLEKLRLRIWG